MSNLRYVRTGPNRFLKMNEADYKAWIKAGNVEFGAEDAPADEPEAEEAKAVESPVENKARKAPAAKKADS